jgi:hypothetical protein
VSFVAVLAALFISLPVDFLSLLVVSCPKAKGAAHSKPVTSIAAHLVFMGFLLQVLRDSSRSMEQLKRERK